VKRRAAVRQVGLTVAQLVIAFVLFFVPAGTFAFWQAWAYLAVCTVLSAMITLYFKRHDPKLLERRARGPWAEKATSQKWLQLFVIAAWAGAIVLSSCDRRLSWSHVPLLVEIAGFVIVGLGFLTIFLAFKANTFAAVNIAVEADQKVVSTGPYAIVRHPMYTGLLLAVLGTPLALGSWWGLITLVLMALAIIWRVLFEERFLVENLPGYVDYCRNVRYRVLPLVW
jgi:protein-S-isoprenylcysteine O-methyltransferase Ste14